MFLSSFAFASSDSTVKLQFHKSKGNKVIFNLINGSSLKKGQNLTIENYDFNKKTISIKILKLSKNRNKILASLPEKNNYKFKPNEYFKTKHTEKISTYKSTQYKPSPKRSPTSVDKSAHKFAGFDHINEEEIKRYFEDDSSVKLELEQLQQQLGSY